MYGVIIWSDQALGRAVIWCEDHGDLAFYGGEADSSIADSSIKVNPMEPGDLVFFELREDNKLRLALNPRLVAADEYPTLTHDLRETGQEIATATHLKPNLRSVTPPPRGNSKPL
jgi:hypothetical protein